MGLMDPESRSLQLSLAELGAAASCDPGVGSGLLPGWVIAWSLTVSTVMHECWVLLKFFNPYNSFTEHLS